MTRNYRAPRNWPLKLLHVNVSQPLTHVLKATIPLAKPYMGIIYIPAMWLVL